MSLWTRLTNVFGSSRINREIDEELDSHIAEALADGRDPEEARRAFGSSLRHREASRDARLCTWLDSLRADAVFGLRQLRKNKITSAAAILSLALAFGACTAAFRLIDALLFRPLPVSHPEELFVMERQGIGPEGKPQSYDGWEYPVFQRMRQAAKGQAELIAVSYADRNDITYAGDDEMEKAYLQYVSGWMFQSFGLQPALGRLLTEQDDLTPGAHPYAVLSYDYWTHRFGEDPKIVGQTFRMGNQIYEIVGVSQKGFTGTEPGTVNDIFVPTMMHECASRSDCSWFRTLARINAGVMQAPLRAKLEGVTRGFLEERAKGFKAMSPQAIQNFVGQRVVLEPASAGVSSLQETNRLPLVTLAVLVVLVLLIACANTANLLTAQAAAREREMALRVSIGGGRLRLIQLVLVGSAWIAVFAGVVGALLAWGMAPLVVRMINPPDNPVRLVLAADWRVVAFGIALTFAVTLLFGLAPALRASAVQPAAALKGGENPHARHRLMSVLAAMQVAFCILVVYIAGLFTTTFERLSHRPTGFSAERILTLDTVPNGKSTPEAWEQLRQRVSAVPGVERVALNCWPLLSEWAWNDGISVNGAPPGDALAYFLSVSPGWAETMKIDFIDGEDFRATDTYPGAAIVNQAFAKLFFPGENPVGKSFEEVDDEGPRKAFHVVGLLRDACYRDLRECVLPTVYVPFGKPQNGRGTFVVRTVSANPAALAQTLRKVIPQANPAFRVSRIRTQQEINDAQTIRERLLATLGLFFAVVAVLLAAVGLFGVLHYSVLQQRRDIGIRLALGAQASNIVRKVCGEVFAMVLAGIVAGIALGFVAVKPIEALFYGVSATDFGTLTAPILIILFASVLAALPPVLRAIHIDPASMLRVE
ncbi:MAG TPA: ABC transporter permease [Dongiaceae bacterium]|nr:ABC transporter permease [Dongiaceae bacterium]